MKIQNTHAEPSNSNADRYFVLQCEQMVIERSVPLRCTPCGLSLSANTWYQREDVNNGENR